MDYRNEQVLKALLSRCPLEERQALERFLPDHERLLLSELPSFDETPVNEDFFNQGTLESVHWSWLVPVLQHCSAREQRLYLSALNPQTAERLAVSLDLAQAREELTDSARSFLKEHLLKILAGPDSEQLPSEYLPTSTLNRLLLLSKKQLIQLIDFLALHDLSIEFRQIVETKILKKIYSFLSEEQKTILQQITSPPEANPFGRLWLDRWDGAAETLRTLLHRRGLIRLGSALTGQNPDLIWLICHKLDIGRGSALAKMCTKESVQGVSETSKRQVEELMDQL